MQTSQEHFTTMLMQNFMGRGKGKTGCIMGNWKIENLLTSDDMDDVISRISRFCLCKQSARQCDKRKIVP